MKGDSDAYRKWFKTYGQKTGLSKKYVVRIVHCHMDDIDSIEIDSKDISLRIDSDNFLSINRHKTSFQEPEIHTFLKSFLASHVPQEALT